jgi:peptidoglycan/LPS O-acetylase OafA/YrhL
MTHPHRFSPTNALRFGTRGKKDATALPKSKFRQDIQGLRALAVGIVVLDHAHVPGISGGFVGVDVFFVISGFLITGLLLGDIAKHSRVRFMSFYSRRAQRILPAATVVIATTAAASIFLLGIIQARATLVDSVWAVFFAANIHFASVGTNYFAASTATSPLQHFWSLAVEEQFYLVWPAVLGIIAVLFCKKGVGHVPRVPIAVTLLVVGGGSLYLSITQTAANSTAAYFSTLDRTWELAVGALLAVALPWLNKIPSVLRSALSWSGLVAIIAAALVFTTHTAIPGYMALLPVLGCGALLVGGIAAPRFGAHSLLSLKPLRFLGDISYSLYLWHWPILIIGAAYLGARDTLTARAGLIATSVAIATVSYYGLENPLRHIKVLSARAWRGLLLWPVATGIVVSIAVFGAPSVPFAAAATATNTTISPLVAIEQAVVAAQGNAPVPAATDPSLLTAGTDHVNLGSCSQYPTFTGKVCQLGDPTGTKTMVLFGDSHSTMWEPALAIIAKAHHWKLYAVVREGCGYDSYVGILAGERKHNVCTTFYSWAKIQVAKLHPTMLIIGSYTNTADWQRGETDVINQFKSDAKRLVLFSNSPETRQLSIGVPAPDVCLLSSGATQGTCLVPDPAARVTAQVQAAAIAAKTHVQYLDVTNLFCDQGLCPAVIDGLIPTYDGAHLTPQYSAFLAPALGPALNLAGTHTVPIIQVPLPATPGTTTTPAN